MVFTAMSQYSKVSEGPQLLSDIYPDGLQPVHEAYPDGSRPQAIDTSASEPHVWQESPKLWSDSNQVESAPRSGLTTRATGRSEDVHKVAGLRPWQSWTLLCCLALVVIGASVGGAVGGTMAYVSISTLPWLP
jgi:hypothetical protein